MSMLAELPPQHLALTATALLSRKSVDQGLTLGEGVLQSLGPVTTFARDQEIFGQGDDTEVFYRVAFGVVRTCKFLSDGRRQIEAFLTEGDLFGLETGPTHACAAEAVTDCGLVSYRRRAVESSAARDERVLGQLYRHALTRLDQAREHALVLGRRSAFEKVAAFLLEWTERSKSRALITLAMTRQDIGDYLGLTIETVSRTLSEMERDGILAIPSPRQIKIKDLAALQDLCA
jgi:CRP/FNR family nitrogen fixation transcriptional regulator